MGWVNSEITTKGHNMQVDISGVISLITVRVGMRDLTTEQISSLTMTCLRELLVSDRLQGEARDTFRKRLLEWHQQSA